MPDLSSQFSPLLFLEKVRDGQPLEQNEIQCFISDLDKIPNEQVSAFLAHAFHKPLNAQNMVHLTMAMRDSGQKLNWEGFNKPVVDKHSTGGVGDKITICLAPLLAALGMAVPTITGKGLGFTGGTVDKLESIPGLDLNLNPTQLEHTVREFGFAFGVQTKEIAPADQKLYAMRDVTGTVPSIPLITASILSKKLAESLGYLILDVKYGTGAFMKTQEQAKELAQTLVKVANGAGTKTAALITSMNQPLGLYSGNWCETTEALRVLKESPEQTQDIQDIRELTTRIAMQALLQTGLESDQKQARKRVEEALSSGKPFEIFCRVVRHQKGDVSLLEGKMPLLQKTKHELVVKAQSSGYLESVATEDIGNALKLAKAGREKITDQIAYNTSLEHPVKIGDQVKEGDVLCVLRSDHNEKFELCERLLKKAFTVSDQKIKSDNLIREVIS